MEIELEGEEKKEMKREQGETMRGEKDGETEKWGETIVGKTEVGKTEM